MEYLKSAELKTENKAELYSDFIACSHVLNKPQIFEEYTTKLRNSGFITSEVLEYNKNVLRSIESSQSYIVTNGWEDTYPLLTLLKQENKSNLEVINVEWLMDEEYRVITSLSLNISNHPFNGSPYDWIYEASQKTTSNVYYTPTLPSSVLLKAQNSLTPMGLVFSLKNETASNQKMVCVDSWKRFSKLELVSNSPLSKNYILLFNVLESFLSEDKSEKGTYQQVKDYKKQLVKKFPELKR